LKKTKERKCEYVDANLPELIKIVDNMGEIIEQKISDKKTFTLSPMDKEDRGRIEYDDVDYGVHAPPVRSESKKLM